MDNRADHRGRTDEALRRADRPHVGPARRRYLWTDVFAVCNFLGLARATGDSSYEELALRLIDQVHHELGVTVPTNLSVQDGLSGLSDRLAEAHPTFGGLRIGKPMPERGSTEPFASRARVGARWSVLSLPHQVDARARSSGRGRPDRSSSTSGLASSPTRRTVVHLRPPRREADELEAQHRPIEAARSVDGTTRSARRSCGPACSAAQQRTHSAHRRAELSERPPISGDRSPGARDGRSPRTWWAPCRCLPVGALAPGRSSFPAARRCRTGLDTTWAKPSYRPRRRSPGVSRAWARDRLAGVPALEFQAGLRPEEPHRNRRASSLRSEIESSWMRPAHRRTPTWTAHEDINDVMLATSLVPEGFLAIDVGTGARKRSGDDGSASRPELPFTD